MTAKEYLQQYQMIASRLRAIEGMIKDLHNDIANLGIGSLRSAWPDGQPHTTGVTDPTGAQAIKAASVLAEEKREKLRQQLLDLELREYKARAELWRQRLKIEETIGGVTEPVYNEILHRRYIKGDTFELIAVDLGYSYRHVIRLHGQALNMADAQRKKKKS